MTAPQPTLNTPTAPALSYAPFEPPLSSFVFYWILLAGTYLLLICGGPWALLAGPAAALLFNGCHEAVHGSLVPRRLFSKRARSHHNLVAGTLGYAVLGHNYLLLRASHLAHHRCGRSLISCSLEVGYDSLGWLGRVRYYLLLFGLGHTLYEAAGYLYAVLPARFVPMYSRFEPRRYGPVRYRLIQLSVALITILVISRAGALYFITFRFVLMAYWGMTQNAAHYGLEVGRTRLSRFASRSYEVASPLSFLLFGSPFYHLAHHVFPALPGVRLRNPAVAAAVEERLQGQVLVRSGIAAYVADFLRQLRGPLTVQQCTGRWLQPTCSAELHVAGEFPRPSYWSGAGPPGRAVIPEDRGVRAGTDPVL